MYYNTKETKKSHRLLYFIALTLFIALINLLVGDRAAGVVLIAGISAWLIGVLIMAFLPADENVLPKCSSSAPPACPPEPCPCQQDGGDFGGCSSDTMQCIDLHL